VAAVATIAAMIGVLAAMKMMMPIKAISTVAATVSIVMIVGASRSRSRVAVISRAILMTMCRFNVPASQGA
jgi:hypothetical protein